MAIRLWLYGKVAGALSLVPSALCQWDCDWYLGLAQFGYQAHPKITHDVTFGQANWAFFPVYPLLVRAMHAVTWMPYDNASIAVSNLALCWFVFISALYLKRLRPGTSGAALAVFLFAVPSSFYFSLPYTEAVFAALTMTVFYLLRRDNLPAAAAASAVLSATRVTGIVVTPLIVLRYLAKISAGWRRDGRAGALAELRQAVLPVAVAPLGLFLYMAYMYHHVGDAFAFIHIQHAWGRSGDGILSSFFNGLLSFDLNLELSQHQQSGTFSAITACCGLAVAYRLLRLQLFGEFVFVVAGTLLPLSHGVGSLPRFVFADPVFLVFLFDFIWSTRYRLMFREIIILSIFLQIYLVHLWIGHYAIF